MKTSSAPNTINRWAKLALLIIVVFLVGFTLPLLLKNYLSSKSSKVSRTPPPAAPAAYLFTPDKLTLSVGEQKQVKLLLDTAGKPIEAFDLKITYNPAVVAVTAVNATPIFPIYSVLRYGNGQITIKANIGIGNKPFAVKDVLALIKLQAKGKGITTFVIHTDKSVLASNGNNILRTTNSLAVRVE